MLGFDVPTRITATVELPRRGAHRRGEPAQGRRDRARRGLPFRRGAASSAAASPRSARTCWCCGASPTCRSCASRRPSTPTSRPTCAASTAPSRRRSGSASAARRRGEARDEAATSGARRCAARHRSLAAGGLRRVATGAVVADRLVVARPTDAVSLDPARTSDIESLEVAEQVYGRLVRFSAGPPRARGRSGDQLDGQLGRHHLDLRAAPERPLPRRHAVRRRRGRVLVRAPDRARAPRPRGRLRLDARLPQHPPRARRRAAARAVRDRSPLRAVPRQPGDGAGGDRLAHGGAQVGARLRPAPRRRRAVPLRRVDPGRPHHAGAQPGLLGRAARTRATWC